MKTLLAAFAFATAVMGPLPTQAAQKPEPLAITFDVQLTLTNRPGDLERFFFTISGQSQGRDGSDLAGDGFFNIQTDPNIFVAVVSLTDADGDQIWFDLTGAQHALDFTELVSLGFYDTRAGGIYTVRTATGKYAGLKDKGTFAGFRLLTGQATLTLSGTTPIPPLPISRKR